DDLETRLCIRAAKRKWKQQSRPGGLRIRTHSLEHTLIELPLPGFVVARQRQLQLDRDHLRSPEAGIDGAWPGKAREHQPRADEQSQRERDLSDDESTPDTGARRVRPSPISKIVVEGWL